MKKGIAVVGSILVDKINEISAYPKEGELTSITRTSLSVGGCVPNVAIDLKKISSETPVFAVGNVGKDEEGQFVLNTLQANGVNTLHVRETCEKTSFTEVMSVTSGQRTFFTFAGASATFGCDDVNLEKLNVKILHLGYFLLLKKVDEGDGEKILKRAQELGISTSIDLVSENSNRYSLVLPCLKYTNNVIINEVEAGKLAGTEPTKENVKSIAAKIKQLGVKERVIIHCPDFGVCLGNDGFCAVPSYNLPKGFIKGTTGAGDAFCAGALYGIYCGLGDKEILEFASACAVASLSAVDATSGLASKQQIIENCSKFGRKELCL